MAKKQPKMALLRSGKGTAYFPSLRDETIFEGTPTNKRQIGWIHQDAKDDAKLIEACEAAWQSLLDDPEAWGLTAKNVKAVEKDPDDFDRPNMPYKEDEKTGGMLFKASTNHRNSEGELNKPVRVWDAAAKPTEEDVLHGAIVKVAVRIRPYVINDRNYGVTMYIDGVQLIQQGEGLGGSNPFEDESDGEFARQVGHDAGSEAEDW